MKINVEKDLRVREPGTLNWGLDEETNFEGVLLILEGEG
jgi:hypothetical protein